VVRLRCVGRIGVHTGFLRDLSRGGMFLRLVDPEPVGAPIGFEISLPGVRARIRGSGEVAWARPRYEGPGRPPGMAVRFVTLETAGAAALAELLGAAPRALVVEAPPFGVQLGAAAVDGDWGDELPAVAPEPVGEAGLAEANSEAARALASPPSIASASPAGADAPAGWSSDGGGAESRALADFGVDVTSQSAGEHSAFGPVGRAVPEQVEDTGQGAKRRVRQRLAALGLVATLALAAGAWWLLVGSGDFRGAGARSQSAAERRASQSAEDGKAGARPGSGAPADRERAPDIAGAETEAAVRVVGAPVSAPGSPGQLSAVAAPALGPATRLLAARWQVEGERATVVVLTFDGAVTRDRVRASRIGGEAPRELLEIAGMARSRDAGPWQPGTSEVRAIRTGFHAGSGGDAGELHVVLDLADAGVRLTSLEPAGAELRLGLTGR
jgi:uncharacterized protein (TIGR02266 family)